MFFLCFFLLQIESKAVNEHEVLKQLERHLNIVPCYFRSVKILVRVVSSSVVATVLTPLILSVGFGIGLSIFTVLDLTPEDCILPYPVGR